MNVSSNRSACVGVDGCRGGWVAVIEVALGVRPRAEAFASFADLLREAGSEASVVVDMPIGLPEVGAKGGRACERALRAVLGTGSSSVFSIPSREAVYAVTVRPAGMAQIAEAHGTALAVARRTSQPPCGFSRQSFMILPKIQEIDQLLLADLVLRERVFESHPEAAFWRMNGGRILEHRKKKRGRVWEAGMTERRHLLAQQGLDATWLVDEARRLRLQRSGELSVGTDDFLDACAMLVVARRVQAGAAEPIPNPFPRDGKGLPMAIWT